MPAPPFELTPADDMLARLERLLATSPADQTEVAWIEARRTVATSAGDEPPATHGERTILLRVRQSGHTGLHRTGGATASELENALRDALAQARLNPPTPHSPLAGPAQADAGAPDAAELHDPALAALKPGAAGRNLLLAAGPRRGEALRLQWLEGHVAVATSAGARRLARVTAACAAAYCGLGPGTSGTPGAGGVRSAARRLDRLDLAGLLALARARYGPAAAEGARTGTAAAAAATTASSHPARPAAALVLSESSVAALLDVLNRHALSSAAWNHAADASGALGTPGTVVWWPDAVLGERIAAPCFNLRDDATLAAGLPFPFDLAGWSKRPVDLVGAGILLTPAADAAAAAALSRQPTPHAVAHDESRASNLILWPGPGDDSSGDGAPTGGVNAAGGRPLGWSDLLRQAEGGLWIGDLAAVAAFDTRRLRFRAMASGVRRIHTGELGEALPDFVWEESLADLLAGAVAMGDQPLAVPSGDPLFGATLTPPLAIRF